LSRFMLSALFLLTISLAPLLNAIVPQGPEEVVWRTDYAAARTEANAAKKPLFVVFRCVR
jgi:uncharacterized membrane protein YeiB